MNESKRTSQVLKRFRELYPDGIAWKFNDRIARSRPDAMFLHHGRTVFVEFKMPGNDLTPGQHLELQSLAKKNGQTFVVWFYGKLLQVFVVLSEGPVVLVQDGLTTDQFCKFVS